MIIIDPMLMAPPNHPDGSLSSSPQFWNEIVEWASDRRVHIGKEVHAFLVQEYAYHGYPSEHLSFGDDSPSRREYERALGQLLSRVVPHGQESCGVSSRPEYLGASEYWLALQLDISGTAGTGVAAIATAAAHWGVGSESGIYITPSPPEGLELCLSPGAVLAAETASEIRKFYRGKRLHVVGGRIDEHIVSALASLCGLEEADIKWLPCERAKPPRDLKKRWRLLTPDRDITICITGRVGHSTSGEAVKAASKAGVPHLLAEFPGEMEQALVEYALRAS